LTAHLRAVNGRPAPAPPPIAPSPQSQ